MARASILWLVGEYAERVPKIAPDVLRSAAKTFIKEVITCLRYSLPSFLVLYPPSFPLIFSFSHFLLFS